MTWSDGLTGDHLEIAQSASTRLAVLAGPGTGKTGLALMRRVARLLESGECQPREVLLLTFTRTSAADLVSKLAELGTPGAQDVHATTIHSFALSLLQREQVLAAIGRRTRILLEHERDLLLRDLTGDFGDIRHRRRLLLAFEAGWARRVTDHPGAIDAADMSFEAQALGWLRHHNAMLVGEVVPLAFEYLRTNPTHEERTRYRHILVDEYQDLNRIEQELVELLVHPEASTFYSGDDDQSIYRFRYADPSRIVGLAADPGVEHFTLMTCGRCPPAVVSLANSLIRHAPARDKPDLVPLGDAAGRVSTVQWPSPDAEIAGLASAIAGDIARDERAAGDFLILVNRRQTGYAIRQALIELGVEAHSYFQDNALKSSSRAQASLAALRLLTNPDDGPALRVWLADGDATGRADAYRQLMAAARAETCSEIELLRRVAAGRSRAAIGLGLTRRFRELNELTELLAPLPLAALVERLFPEAEPDLSLIGELARLCLATADDATQLLRDIVAAISQPEVPQQPDFVRIMSIHKSKGLTSPVVFVGLAIDGILPTISDRDPEEEQAAAFEEQRRLAYVGLTRAADELVLSYPAAMTVASAYAMRARTGRRYRQGGDFWARTLPTPYLRELGATQPAPIPGDQWLARR